jgi:predicted alpha/beta superfamily hydrolase
MKRILTFGMVIIITSALSILVFSFLTGDETPDSEGIILTSVFSDILGEERELTIHLPRDYDSITLYPVMYVLDGGYQDTHIANKFDVLTAAGYAPKTIVVGIPNMSAKTRERNLTPPFMRNDNDDKDSEFGEADTFLRFMESELFPFIENNYRASRLRLLSGNSRGGLLVMYSLLYKSDMFQARFCYSTPFWRQDNILVSKVGDFLHSKDTLNTFIYMSAGENETDNIKNGLNRMTTKLKEKASVGLVLYSEYTPNAIHQNNSMISASTGIARWSEYIKR